MPFFDLLRKRATRPPTLAAAPPHTAERALASAAGSADGPQQDGATCATHSYQVRLCLDAGSSFAALHGMCGEVPVPPSQRFGL